MRQTVMQKHPSAHVALSSDVQNDLLKDVCERSDVEACGLLLGSSDEQGNWQIEQVYPMHNIYSSPVYFEFSPEELLTAEMEHPGQIVGVYHSHPTGLATASSTDRENMQRVNCEQDIPWVWLVISGPFNDAFQHKQSIKSSVVAYHHYKKLGLRQITVQLGKKCDRTHQLTYCGK